jgi:hypothetical protein
LSKTERPNILSVEEVRDFVLELAGALFSKDLSVSFSEETPTDFGSLAN